MWPNTFVMIVCFDSESPRVFTFASVLKRRKYMFDVIPDTHGQSDKPRGALGNLGYRERNGAWRHIDQTRHVVFLGYFIDCGPDNREVIRVVRSMFDAGTASAVMENHELNAIHFHTFNKDVPLREHDEEDMAQHASFGGGRSRPRAHRNAADLFQCPLRIGYIAASAFQAKVRYRAGSRQD